MHCFHSLAICACLPQRFPVKDNDLQMTFMFQDVNLSHGKARLHLSSTFAHLTFHGLVDLLAHVC